MSKPANILSFSQARASLKALMERVTADKLPAIITRQGGEPVVMIRRCGRNSPQKKGTGIFNALAP